MTMAHVALLVIVCVCAALAAGVAMGADPVPNLEVQDRISARRIKLEAGTQPGFAVEVSGQQGLHVSRGDSTLETRTTVRKDLKVEGGVDVDGTIASKGTVTAGQAWTAADGVVARSSGTAVRVTAGTTRLRDVMVTPPSGRAGIEVQGSGTGLRLIGTSVGVDASDIKNGRVIDADGLVSGSIIYGGDSFRSGNAIDVDAPDMRSGTLLRLRAGAKGDMLASATLARIHMQASADKPDIVGTVLRVSAEGTNKRGLHIDMASAGDRALDITRGRVDARRIRLVTSAEDVPSGEAALRIQHTGPTFGPDSVRTGVDIQGGTVGVRVQTGVAGARGVDVQVAQHADEAVHVRRGESRLDGRVVVDTTSVPGGHYDVMHVTGNTGAPATTGMHLEGAVQGVHIEKVQQGMRVETISDGARALQVDRGHVLARTMEASTEGRPDTTTMLLHANDDGTSRALTVTRGVIDAQRGIMRKGLEVYSTPQDKSIFHGDLEVFAGNLTIHGSLIVDNTVFDQTEHLHEGVTTFANLVTFSPGDETRFLRNVVINTDTGHALRVTGGEGMSNDAIFVDKGAVVFHNDDDARPTLTLSHEGEDKRALRISQGNLEVDSGKTILGGPLEAQGAVFDGNVEVPHLEAESVTITGNTLTVSGLTTLNNDLQATSATFSQTVNVPHLSATSGSFTSSLTTQALTANSDTTFNGDLIVNGEIRTADIPGSPGICVQLGCSSFSSGVSFHSSTTMRRLLPDPGDPDWGLRVRHMVLGGEDSLRSPKTGVYPDGIYANMEKLHPDVDGNKRLNS